MEARLRRVIINPLALLSLMRNDSAYRVTLGIPKNATLQGFTLDPQTQNLILFIIDESFELVDVQNTVSPLLSLEVRRVQ